MTVVEDFNCVINASQYYTHPVVPLALGTTLLFKLLLLTCVQLQYLRTKRILYKKRTCSRVAVSSGVVRLGHTGARALATRGHAAAPPVQVELSALIVSLSIANRALNGLEIERRSIAMYISTEL